MSVKLNSLRPPLTTVVLAFFVAANPASADPMVDPAACRELADRASVQLSKRLAAEKEK